MKKLKMCKTNALTFKEGCKKYLEYCRQRNLRQVTINHYKQSYTQFYKYFDPNMPVSQLDQRAYNDYALHLCETLHNDVKEELYLDFDLAHTKNVSALPDKYVDYFNNYRPVAALGYKSPVQYKTELGF